jgi:hypothetical protein
VVFRPGELGFARYETFCARAQASARSLIGSDSALLIFAAKPSLRDFRYRNCLETLRRNRRKGVFDVV